MGDEEGWQCYERLYIFSRWVSRVANSRRTPGRQVNGQRLVNLTMSQSLVAWLHANRWLLVRILSEAERN